MKFIQRFASRSHRRKMHFTSHEAVSFEIGMGISVEVAGVSVIVGT